MSGLHKDSGDPWTFFGQFSQGEIDRATQLLAASNIAFYISEDVQWDKTSKWSGPYCLWIQDDHSEKAASLLVPLFKSNKPN